ncbi:hypothetical protein DRQ33_01150 [bacterium]|nr:MAG: hypothetical protein DRQ33_01150 [bacterium]
MIASNIFALGQAKQPMENRIIEIRFSATRCYGFCPAYEVIFTVHNTAKLVWEPFHRNKIIKRDSMFTHIAGENVPSSALESDSLLVFDAIISDEQFDSLTETFIHNHFWDMEDYRERITDLPTYYFTVLTDTSEKTISMYGLEPPQEMMNLKKYIENLIMKIRWEFSGEIERK